MLSTNLNLSIQLKSVKLLLLRYCKLTVLMP
uniref:Uncharacterized protein n=1 Tax=Rhizophora mucronata TaxID=61149 RepID=A0A2P2MBP2_RHIMU